MSKDVPATMGINEKPTRFFDIPTVCAKCGNKPPEFLEIVKHLNPWTYQLNAKCHGAYESIVWEMIKYDPKLPVTFFSK